MSVDEILNDGFTEHSDNVLDNQKTHYAQNKLTTSSHYIHKAPKLPMIKPVIRESEDEMLDMIIATTDLRNRAEWRMKENANREHVR